MILLQLTANTGPEECCLAVRKALSQLLHECAESDVRAEPLEQVPGERTGNFRSVLLALEGAQAPALASRWGGSVQWVCPSPYRPGHRRKNWFIGVDAFDAEVRDARLDPREQDICYEAVRASGPGGQHVNKTDSAVRATHLPTGQSVKVQTERSQHANKRLAKALLAHKLKRLAEGVTDAARHQRWRQHHDVERGNATRTFVGEHFVERATAR